MKLQRGSAYLGRKSFNELSIRGPSCIGKAAYREEICHLQGVGQRGVLTARGKGE